MCTVLANNQQLQISHIYISLTKTACSVNQSEHPRNLNKNVLDHCNLGNSILSDNLFILLRHVTVLINDLVMYVIWPRGLFLPFFIIFVDIIITITTNQ